jgi:hypothetical protein
MNKETLLKQLEGLSWYELMTSQLINKGRLLTNNPWGIRKITVGFKVAKSP